MGGKPVRTGPERIRKLAQAALNADVTVEQVDTILREIVRAAELNDTGRGIAFVLPVGRVVGVAHLMSQTP